MKFVVPNYYKDFQCIASACRHSCCVGWEIDIDADTYSYYNDVDGDIGERLKEGIAVDDGQPHFILDKNDRCPFLSSNGLCDIITQCGEDSLCDICADHPRFRNFFSDRTEIGLGLCCEAASDLIINYKDTFALVTDEDDGFEDELYEEDKEILLLRNSALETATDNNLNFEEKAKKLFGDFSVDTEEISPAIWAERLISLERLDFLWDECLEFIGKETALEYSFLNRKAAENLLCYFIFRHLSSACDGEDAKRRVAFAVFSCRIIFTLAKRMPIEEAARMYSSEIEYSDENLNSVLGMMCD